MDAPPHPIGIMSASHPRIAAWVLTALALLSILIWHLLPALLAGLLVFELVHLMAPLLERRLTSRRAKLVAVALLATVITALVVLAIIGTAAFFRSDHGSLPALATKMAEIIDDSRQTLPAWLIGYLPDSAEGIRNAAVQWLRDHGAELQLAGKEAARGFAHVLIGLIVGAMLALREATTEGGFKPLAAALVDRAMLLADAFRRIVFAQVRISALNTLFTGIYLAVVLPALGVHLPLTKTMIALTFIVGLLPVIGNLISNTVIVVVSLAHSTMVAFASLAFLVIIHKLEYFLNARIVGAQISARAWELLLAMLTLEAIFGLPGVIAAPIFYAYLKAELKRAELI